MKLETIQKEMLEIAVEFDLFCEKHGLAYVICGGSLLGAVRHKDFIPWDDDFDVAMPRSEFERFLTLWSDSEKYSIIKIGDPEYYKTATPAKIFLKGTRVSEFNEKKNGMPEFCPYGVFLDVFPLDEYQDNFIGHSINKYVGKLILAKSLSKYHLRNRSFLSRSVIKLFRLIPQKAVEVLKNMSLSYVLSTKDNRCGRFVGYGVETPFTNLVLKPEKMWPQKREYIISDRMFYGPNSADDYLKCRFGDYWKLPALADRKQHILKVKQAIE